ncbi:hypothetical protein [Microbacterium sp. NPDC087665]|uniref:hypothetical protein n=1 Tax=Microbacterium sp. NPDC087665 TaxID=3364194 RepID=UPI003820C31F
MNEPQIWVLIGVFAAAIFGMITIVSTLFVQVIKAEIRSVHTRIDTLDRDVSALYRHVLGIDRE